MRDREFDESQLRLAQKQIQEIEQKIREQKRRIDTLRKTSADTSEEHEVLSVLLDIHHTAVLHRAVLLARFGRKDEDAKE